MTERAKLVAPRPKKPIFVPAAIGFGLAFALITALLLLSQCGGGHHSSREGGNTTAPSPSRTTTATAPTVTASPNGDESGYLAAIQEEAPFVYNKYGQANILDLGHRVCKWSSQGVGDIDIVIRIQELAPMSDRAASKIVVKAQRYFGC
ncbi:MAG: hypothetical protein KDB71_15500 [Mycobacterium sp.]|nr:hypothetical protein [Mycobacterium sp.]